MSLKSKIEEEIKFAMLKKDKDRLRALRAIKSQILLAETEKGGHTELSEDIEIKILQKAVKQRRDSIEIFEKQNRNDLSEIEKSELVVIEEFLPIQMSENELEKEIRLIIEQTGASGASDMGKIIGLATKKFSGKSDGKTISIVVKKLLLKQ